MEAHEWSSSLERVKLEQYFFCLHYPVVSWAKLASAQYNAMFLCV